MDDGLTFGLRLVSSAVNDNFLAMKNSIIFISALSLVAMLLVSCNSTSSPFAPDETATTGVTRQTNEAPRERSAEDSVNSISGGHH